MGLFGIGGKKKEVLDLTENYKRQQERAVEVKKEQASSQSDSFNFLGNLAQSGSANGNSEDFVNVPEAEDRKKRLAKRFAELTSKIEEISNQLYHLQQRVEVLERKAGVKGFE